MSDDPECQTKNVCEEKHKRVDEKLDCYERDIATIKKLIADNAKSVDRKVLATLIFFIYSFMFLSAHGNCTSSPQRNSAVMARSPNDA